MNSLIIRTPGRRKAAAITLLAFGWILLAWFMGVLVPASAQDETDPSGKLVAAPSSLAVGDSVEVVAFEVQPANLLVAFQYDEHLVLVGESCDDAATRTTVPIRAPVWIPLEACTAGEGHIRLLEAATDTVIAETTITIAEAGVGVSPQTEDEVIVQQQGCGQMFELPCPPPPDIDYTTSPSPPSANYSITVSWGVGGCDKYSVTGGLGNYEGSSTSKNYNRPCERSYNVSVQSYGDGVNYMEVWSFVSSRTVTTPGCPVTTPTPPPTNNPPAFSSASTSRSVPENTPSGRNIGSPVTATDQDGDSLTYSMGGTDASSFSIVTSSGQLKTSAALDYETKSSYSVTVTAEDPSDASDFIAVAINVTDVDEGTDPVCSTPSSVRNLEVDAGDRRLDLGWERPSDDGDCDIEYNVEYKPSSSSMWSSTHTVTTSSYSITGLANGTEHDVQVQACNDARCGDWSEESGTPQPPLPGQVPRPMLVPGDQELEVSWDPTGINNEATVDMYRVRYRLTSDTNWEDGGSVSSESDSESPPTEATITGLTNDSEYEVQVQACVGPSWCGVWSESATERVGVRYAKPVILDLIPLPERWALLTWENSKNEDVNTVYEVYTQAASSETAELIGTTVVNRLSEHQFRLDSLAEGKHLGEESYFRIWVVAKEKHDPEGTERVANSDRSDEIRIVDSPIVAIIGKSDEPDLLVDPGGNIPGKAIVKWDRPERIVGYSLRWRKLGNSSGNLGIPHSSPNWRLDEDSLPEFRDDDKVLITDPLQLQTTISNLAFNNIYAVQMNYKTRELVQRPNGTAIREIPVFSARDRFVWTSDKAADNGQRIATFPLTKRLKDRTFSYVFCDDTFPDSNSPTWEEFTEYVFKKWEFATDHLITIDLMEDKECADYSMFVDAVRPELLTYIGEFEADEMPSSGLIEVFVENFVKNLDAAGYESTVNADKLISEVLLIEDVDEPLYAAGVFDEVSRKVGHGFCLFVNNDDEEERAGGCAVGSTINGTHSESSPTSIPTPYHSQVSTGTPSPTLTRVPYRVPTPRPTPTSIEINGRSGQDTRNVCGPSPLGPFPGMQHDHFLHWVPDGSQLIFGHAEKVWRVDEESGELVEVVDVNPVQEGSSKGRGMAYSFYASISPDGSQIVYTTCAYRAANLPSYYYGSSRRTKLGYELAVVGINGSEERRLTRNSVIESYAVWSPDGTKLAYYYGDFGGQLHIADIDDMVELNSTQIVATGNVSPSYPPVWSPDGQRIAFTTKEKEGRTYRRVIYTVRADGSDINIIGESDTLPTWSPDGKRLAFAWSDDVSASIYTVRYDGTDLRLIWFRGSDERNSGVKSLAWSPDGSEILVVPKRLRYLWALDPEGNGSRSLKSLDQISAYFQDAVWSPDGSRIAAVSWAESYNRENLLIISFSRDETDPRVLVAARPLEDDNRNHQVEIFAATPPLRGKPTDTSTCSGGFVVPEPQGSPGLVHDCEVLLGIRDELAGRAFLNWIPDTPILQWEGVEVGGTPLRVQALDLSGRGLTGSIPPELGQLDELTRLSLNSAHAHTPNLLTGPIPPELGNLSKLESLVLSGNFLSGIIPDELGQLENLRVFYAGRNFLTGCIPEGLRELGGQDLEEAGLKYCPHVKEGQQ